jgi:hypothetical protein
MATARRYRSERPQVTVDYDRPVDVLIVTLGERVPMEGEGRPGGVELDFAIYSGTPCAVKVIGFLRNGWSSRVGQLTKEIAEHLSVPPLELAEEIERVVHGY